MKTLILVYFLLSLFSTYGQNIKFSNAPNGLVIRETTDKNSNRVGKLEYGERIEVIKETNIKISISDDGKVINGNWTEIKAHKNHSKGFVFNGYLTSKPVNIGEKSENYYLTKIPPMVLKNHWHNLLNSKKTKPAKIYLRNSKHQDLHEFIISEYEFYEDTSLLEINKTELLNVKNLIVVKINYNSCCSNHYSTYFLQTNNGNFVVLPEIENMHCDGPEPYVTYLFPNDKGGEKNKIICAKVIPEILNSKERIEVLKRFEWNGEVVKEI